MSGYVSELTTCGLKEQTLQSILDACAAEHVDMHYDELYALFYFLYNGVNFNVVSERMEMACAAAAARAGRQTSRGGWCPRSTAMKIPHTAEKLHHLMWRKCSALINKDRELLDHEYNTCPHLKESATAVKGVMDTVPIKVFNQVSRGDEDYSGKYCEYVWKLFSVTSLTGFTIYVAPKLYSGRSGDNVLFDHCDVEEALAAYDNAIIFGDGAFTNSDHVMSPSSKSEVWPRIHGYPSDEEWANYVRRGEELLGANALISHYRARAEHMYARNAFGRFNAFKYWTHNADLCLHSAICALGALNFEVESDHGLCGKYEKTKPTASLRKSLQGQRNRYPQPQRPIRGERRPKRAQRAGSVSSSDSMTQLTLEGVGFSRGRTTREQDELVVVAQLSLC